MMHQYVQMFTSTKVHKTDVSNRQASNRDNDKIHIPGNSKWQWPTTNNLSVVIISQTPNKLMVFIYPVRVYFYSLCLTPDWVQFRRL
jgi:hypothetical protein